ncbi:HAD-IIIC family phosphatase [Catellatospora methionotrophica]|uniref:HAD-IIIC family phosphatase n=1 Tax=Catellatospora methionotrophica TaxID=121620 RepID=UPI0033F7B13B
MTGTTVDTVKCLVWDLDNTLWRGTLLEGDDVTVAQEIRQVVLDLDARGILQSVCSRNDHDPAWERLEQLGLAEYFVVPRIGWGRKSDAIREIAKELQFALHTMAFVDDSPVERAEVSLRLPEVRCYDAAIAATLPALPDFTPAAVTEDARRRRLMYQTSARRDQARLEHTGSDDEFVRTLAVVLTVTRADDASLARVEELTLRTSQMNATGVHYSQDELRALVADPDHEVLVATLADRFGPHGAIGVLLLHRLPGTWHLKLLATSCRVVSLGAGSTILRWLINEADRAGAHLVADFRATDRNRIMEVAYRFAGFTGSDCDGCAAAIAAQDDIQHLHLVPTPSEITTMTIEAPDLAVAAHAATATHECYGFRVECTYDPAAGRMVRDFFGPPVDTTTPLAASGAVVRLAIVISDELPAETVAPPHNPTVMMADPVVIDAGSSRAVLDPAGGHATLTLGRADVDNQVVWGRWILERLFLYLVGRSPRHYPLHAGAVEIEGRSVVLTAEGGVGKSTFTFWALHRGARLIGEDIMVRHLDDKPGTLWGYPRAVYLSPDIVARAPELADADARPIDGGVKARIVLPAGLPVGSVTRPSALVFLVRGDAEPRAVELDEAIARCRDDFSVGKEGGPLEQEVEADLRRLLADVRLFEFSVDDLDDSFDRLRRELGR